MDAGQTTTYTYDEANELEVEVAPAGTRTTYSYDANGNTTVRNADGSLTTYTWDGENRMTKLELPAGDVLTMSYDPSSTLRAGADGLRRKKEEAAGTTKFLWDGQKVLLETDAGDSTVAEYILSTGIYGDLLSQRRSGASSFYHFDALGSTDRLTGADEAVTDSYTYYAFGEERASSGSTTNPYRYVRRLGYYRNGADLLYLRARYYQPGVGRFVSRDPVSIALGPYAYGACRPTTVTDASGLYSCYWCIPVCATISHACGPCLARCDQRPLDPILRWLDTHSFLDAMNCTCGLAQVADIAGGPTLDAVDCVCNFFQETQLWARGGRTGRLVLLHIVNLLDCVSEVANLTGIFAIGPILDFLLYSLENAIENVERGGTGGIWGVVAQSDVCACAALVKDFLRMLRRLRARAGGKQ